jgi:prevent-host-death family protein
MHPIFNWLMIWLMKMAYREIGAFDAKTRLSELLRQVERGERFTITHRGRAIADLVPSAGGAPDAAAAVAAMLTFEGVPGVADEDVADWIADGRQ